MSFPNYSTLFTLGLMAQGCGRPAAPSSKSEGKRPLRSFLKLDLVDAFPPVPRDLPTPPPRPLPVPSAPSTSALQPSPAPSYMALPPTPLLHRRSRESLRAIPSPKPAPSALLPPSPLSTPSSAASLPMPGTPPAPLPPALPESVVGGLGLDLSFPPLPEPAYECEQPKRRLSTMSSIASPRRRLASRSAALALLEGRRHRAVTAPAARRPSNFMSMSDDEDDAVSDADDEDSSDDDADDSDAWPLPPRAAAPAATPSFLPPLKLRPRSASSLPMSVSERASRAMFFDSEADDEPRGSWRSFIDIELVGAS